MFVKQLASFGIIFAENPMSDNYDRGWFEAAYGRLDYDFNVLSASVTGFDPDGIYHLLGETGSLNSPAIYRQKVADALELGRSLKRSDDLHEAYRDVSRAILAEVPVIHLAFLKSGSFYRTDLVKVGETTTKSDRFHFDQFQFQQGAT